MSRVGIYTVNQNAQAVPVNGTISLGSINRRFGCKCNNALDLNGNGITINESGYYDIDISVTATATAAGNVTVTIFNGNVAVPGATATATAAANGTVALPILPLFRQMCGASSNLTLVLTGTAATVNNVSVKIIKIW